MSIITAILGYNNQKINTFNKIKTFKYSKIFAWKYKTTQKSIKIKSQQLFRGKKKKSWSARSFFPYILYEHVGCSVMEALLYWGLCLHVKLLYASSCWASVHTGSVHDCSILVFNVFKTNESRGFCLFHTTVTYLTNPTHPQTLSQLLLCSVPLMTPFLSNNWRKTKSEASMNGFFFFSLNDSF